MLNNDALWYELHELDLKLKKVRKKEVIFALFCTLPHYQSNIHQIFSNSFDATLTIPRHQQLFVSLSTVNL